MDNSDVQLIGGPCGQHGPYTFYKAFKYTKNGIKRIVTLSEFFFVKMWRDSDLLCIGELQLLWVDKNSEQVLASLRLYFLPENTPEGRMDQGEDEVLAISEKVVIRVEDLITWITVEAEWNWGRLARCEEDLKHVEVEPSKCAAPRKPTGTSFTLTESTLDFSDVDNERKTIDCPTKNNGPHVVILSFPKYCRYRAMMKRLEGVEDLYLKYKIVNALGGFYVIHPNTRVLFCRETFDYPELEGHELLCNHLAPKLKGRPRGKRKKRSVSPGSESNESESSLTNSYNTRSESRNGLRCDSTITPRRSTRCHENNENREFVRRLTMFMKSNHTPIGRIPSLGYKELNLHEFFTKVQKLGGYDAVTTNRLWKSIFDDMSGHQNSTSAATVIRRHYERFLLSYERHIKGEEHKPLPVSERRRLKSKRGSSSLSDAESSSGDTTPIPSTSRKTSLSGIPTENKDNTRTEGKPSSLRSIRVKPERQKDKQVNSEKISVQNNNNNNIVQQPSSVKITKEDSKPDSHPRVEKLIIKTESMTVKTECTTVKIEKAPVKSESISVKAEVNLKTEMMPIEMDSTNIKIESILVKTEDSPLKIEKITEKGEKSSVKIEMKPLKTEDLPVKDEIPLPLKSEAVKPEPVPVKPETAPVKIEPIKQENSDTKLEVAAAVKLDSTKVPNKNAEPVTSAATPAAQKVSQDKMLSPVEGKENIPIIKTGDTASKNSPEVIEIPYKPKLPETVNMESGSYRNINSTFIHEVKKRKLDILKEGGLEVTPVRPSSTNPLGKDGRPSVIQQPMPPAQLISKPMKAEIMPPPASNTVPPKRMHITIPQTLNISHVKVSPTTPTKKPTPSTNSFPFINGSTPPKVVQSKSIYSYSEKTVYGNPKDILTPTIKSAVHAPRFVGTAPRQNGGDPVDLSVNSPQKPVVEIMRVPQSPSSSHSPYNRETVTKNLYKTTSSPIMDGRRLGPNLEITLVGPNNKTSANLHKPYHYPPAAMQSSSQQHHHQKRLANEYYHPSKAVRNDENGRFNQRQAQSHRDTRTSIDISGSNPYMSKNSSMKMDPNSHIKQLSQSMKHFPPPSLPAFPPYLSQFYEGNKGASPYLPMIDPAMYYSAAMQSLYSSSAMSSAPPILPIPTPDQLKFYTELMAHSRLGFPFLQQDGSSSLNNNNLKKQ